MEDLKQSLTSVQMLLEDAETKQFQSQAIKNWLSRLNGVVFEIEDILDEYNTLLDRKRGHKKIWFKYKMGTRMKEAAKKLKAVYEGSLGFQLQEIVARHESNQVDPSRDTGYILCEPDHIYGRDQDKEAIVDVLVNQAKDCEKLSVLPITGFGGLGKTTLAQLVYNDERVTHHFDAKFWVCVSDNFVLKVILGAIAEEKSNLEDMNSLHCRVQEKLKGKRYLLILDDVWNENQQDWAILKSILDCGSMGSSIVVTTRLGTVADIMRTHQPHCLSQLLEEHCWLLFKLRAFGSDQNDQHPNLETIGRRIVKKCSGVPLAAKALGGLLRFEREEEEWIHVEESPIWNLPEADSIMQVLRLSYRHLPAVLRRCFAYCALFPKDYRFEKMELIFHWMAHGCISSDGQREMEDVGDHVWNELSLRSFFQQIYTSGEKIRFKMHDLVHDLALFIMENKVDGAEPKNSCAGASNSKIRQVSLSKYPETSSSSIALEVFPVIPFINYNRLRSLKLTYLKMEELPSAIVKLKQLRFLDLSHSSIRSLPRTICRLYNLQILLLVQCEHLKSLPKNIIYMSSLRHIDLQGCSALSGMPYKIGELASLKTLCLFIVGNEKGNQVDELEQLNNLGGTLEIKHLERVKDHRIAKKANLKGKPNLRHLVLKWKGDTKSSKSTNMMEANLKGKSRLRHLMLRWEGDTTSSESTKMNDGEKVMEALQPHSNLMTLEINGFKSRKLASWMKEMKKLTRITLKSCQNCTQLPPLGHLPHLKYLELRELDELEKIVDVEEEIGCPNSSIFPSLEELKLEKLPKLKGLLMKEGAVEEMFPNLKKLEILWCGNCLQLGALGHLPLLKSLILIKVDLLEYIDVEKDEIGCPNSAIFPSLEVLSLWYLPNLKGLLKDEGAHVGKMFPYLQKLSIQGCGNYSQLGPLQYLPLLKSLALQGVDALEYIHVEKDDIGSLNSSIFPSLEKLELYSLPNLRGLFKEEGGGGEMFPNLHSLTIRGCGNCTQLGRLPLLKSLELVDLEALEYIHVEKDDIGCPNSSIFPSLEELKLHELPNLKGLSKEKGAVGEMFPNHEKLRPSLILTSSTFVSSNLKNLKELHCDAKILSLIGCKLENLSSLDLRFDGTTTACNNIPLEGLCNLKSLTVWGASIGSSFPKGWLRHLSALEYLSINDCTEFEATEEDVKQLHLLESLTLFSVRDMVSLPQALRHLPSLQSLTLWDLNNLSSLPEWLPHLHSLTRLVIFECPQIPSLPSGIKGMTNLQSLSIQGCPKLKR